MAKFKFSLQTALDLRRREEDKARRRLASAQREVRRYRADIERTRSRHNALLSSLRGIGDNRRFSVAVDRMEHEHRVLTGLRQRLARQQQRLDEAEARLGRRRSEAVAASQARRTLERLSERQEAEHRRLALLSEQRELNEAAISRHHMKDHSSDLLIRTGTDG